MLNLASMDRAQAKLLLISLVLLAELAFILFQLLSIYIVTSTYVVETIAQETSTATEQVTTRVSAMVEKYNADISRLANDPEIVDLLANGNNNARRAMEELLHYDFPTAISIRLLPPGQVSLDMTATPPLSYAALDQMRLAEDTAQAPPAAVHLFSTPQQHVNIAHPVVDPADSRVIGHIMLSLSFDVLQNIFDDMRGMSGYIELQQTGTVGSPIIALKQGDTTDRAGNAARTIPIEHSLWQVSYWAPVSLTIHLGSISAWILGALLLISTGIIIYIVSLFQQLLDDSTATET